MLIKIEFYLISLGKYPLLINSSLVANHAIESSTIDIIRTEPVKIYLLVVYSKSEYTLESVGMSGRLHDNSSQLHSSELKFCAQNCLISISVEFEDEKDPSRNG